ncbi:pyridoxamine 5'-phosphate oxidase family protein [Kitasatospora sp. NPDC059327]|uniref:pyridoxamine 5'-phosphate oxidase family protein n=1 Tax=Kitasatospora sp. NPDC059327 TaxID=3346803 RepID=UPI0036C53BF9
MVLTPEERACRSGQALGRPATSGPQGASQVRPVGFRLDEDGTIDIGGPRMAAGQKYRDAARDPRVCFLVDDLTPADAPDAPAPPARATACATACATAEASGGGARAGVRHRKECGGQNRPGGQNVAPA